MGLERAPVEAEFVMHIQHAGRAGHQMCLDPECSCARQEPYGIKGTAGAGDTDHQAGPDAHVASICCSSPDWYISIMMSEPPTNSPFT